MQRDKFYEEKKKNDKEIDSLLDDVSANLTKLKSIAMDINVNVSAQNSMLGDMTDLVADTQDHLDVTNSRVAKLVNKYKGCCPSLKECLCLVIAILIIVCIILLLVL